MHSGVIWITGLSGSGKTTLAAALAQAMTERGARPAVLDGDRVRAAIGDERCGHDPVSRLTNAYRLCRLAGLLAEQGHPVIVATMSLFHEIHEWNRRNLPGYFEVLLDVDMETVSKRDAKGHYARGTDLPGVDIAPEMPLSPHLRLRNKGHETPATELARQILRACCECPED